MERVGYVMSLAAVGAALVWFSIGGAFVAARSDAAKRRYRDADGDSEAGGRGTIARDARHSSHDNGRVARNPAATLSATDAPPPSDQAARDATAEIEADRKGVPLVGHPERVRRLLKWAATDPAAATLWADRLTNPAKRQEALQAICFKIAERDPAAAIDMVEIYGLGNEPGVVENLIAQWSARDADGALAWIGHQPPGDERDALTKRVAFALSSSQPVEAARLIEESMGTGPCRRRRWHRSFISGRSGTPPRRANRSNAFRPVPCGIARTRSSQRSAARRAEQPHSTAPAGAGTVARFPAICLRAY